MCWCSPSEELHATGNKEESGMKIAAPLCTLAWQLNPLWMDELRAVQRELTTGIGDVTTQQHPLMASKPNTFPTSSYSSYSVLFFIPFQTTSWISLRGPGEKEWPGIRSHRPLLSRQGSPLWPLVFLGIESWYCWHYAGEIEILLYVREKGFACQIHPTNLTFYASFYFLFSSFSPFVLFLRSLPAFSSTPPAA